MSMMAPAVRPPLTHAPGGGIDPVKHAEPVGIALALAVAQHIVRPPAVIARQRACRRDEGILVSHADAIGQTPVGVLQQLVDFDAGKGLVGQGWGSRWW